MNPPAPQTTTTSFLVEPLRSAETEQLVLSTNLGKDIQLLVPSKVNIFRRVQTVVDPKPQSPPADTSRPRVIERNKVPDGATRNPPSPKHRRNRVINVTNEELDAENLAAADHKRISNIGRRISNIHLCSRDCRAPVSDANPKATAFHRNALQFQFSVRNIQHRTPNNDQKGIRLSLWQRERIKVRDWTSTAPAAQTSSFATCYRLLGESGDSKTQDNHSLAGHEF